MRLMTDSEMAVMREVFRPCAARVEGEFGHLAGLRAWNRLFRERKVPCRAVTSTIRDDWSVELAVVHAPVGMDMERLAASA